MASLSYDSGPSGTILELIRPVCEQLDLPQKTRTGPSRSVADDLRPAHQPPHALAVSKCASSPKALVAVCGPKARAHQPVSRGSGLPAHRDGDQRYLRLQSRHTPQAPRGPQVHRLYRQPTPAAPTTLQPRPRHRSRTVPSCNRSRIATAQRTSALVLCVWSLMEASLPATPLHSFFFEYRPI